MMEERLIAPCGMNCAVCVNYLSQKLNLAARGFRKSDCPGCIPRGKNCAFLKKRCAKLGDGLVRFCTECADFPCARLQGLDARYNVRYHLSMIDNLRAIAAAGIDRFLETETVKWRCGKCGGTICCHNGLCLACDAETLRQNPKYRWNEK